MRRPALLLLILALTLIAFPAGHLSAAEICFPGQPGIDHCLQEPYAGYWRANGGLPVFGYPIGPAENGANGLQVQWTERFRLEAHPENAPPYQVLLGRMGAERLAQLGRDPFAEGREEGPAPGCRWFAETGHNVCNQEGRLGFRAYWESNGLRAPGLDAYNRSLQLFGLPLTAARTETGSDGRPVLTQWFERARFEWHPENPRQFKVLLGLLGREVRGGSPPAAAPTGPSVFGVEINPGLVAPLADRVREAAPGWVRYSRINWGQVETRQGARDWSALAGVEAEIAAISATGATPLVVVHGTPAWAQQVRGSACGPIKADALDDFAAFMGETVARYSRPPYSVKYWELGNEPDAAYAVVPGDQVFGCWGDTRAPFYGGEYYAEMLKAVYPAIKAADPGAQVVLGGLLLECDPTITETSPCPQGRFLEGVLRNGGGAAFDILAYHAYTYWSGPGRDWDLEAVRWKHRGGILRGKLDFLRATMRQYGVDKPVIMNEGGLLCYRSTASCSVPAFYDTQATYAVRMYARAASSGLRGAVWYTLNGPGWQEGGLLDASQAPRPSFRALAFMANLLRGARYESDLSAGPLEGYAFRGPAATYHVYWTNARAPVELALPPGARAAYDRFGQPAPLTGGPLSIGFDPVFVEIR